MPWIIPYTPMEDMETLATITISAGSIHNDGIINATWTIEDGKVTGMMIEPKHD